MYYTSPSVYEFISKQTQDPIVEWKTCRISGAKFPIYQSDLDFYEKISPTFNGQKMKIPTPTLCPEERQRRRLMFRNERKLYRRTCDASGKSIISIYSPDKPYKVYDQKIRRSDARDPMSYGREYDFGVSFTEQFGELMREVPRINVLSGKSENSGYCNYAYNNKDCYMSFTTSSSKNCLYDDMTHKSENILHSSYVEDSENIYASIHIKGSTNIFFSEACNNCSSGWYLYRCDSCSNCYNCTNLVNKQYYINNIQYTKEQYFEKLQEINLLLQKKLYENTFQINSMNIFGNAISDGKESVFVYDGFDIENSKFLANFGGIKDCYDTYALGYNTSQCWEIISGENQNKVLATTNSVDISLTLYTDLCFNSSNLFGCVGLRNKSYCIFNKQYTPEQYNELVPKIIGQMMTNGERGEFFHPSLSPFGYNETVAQEYFPFTNEESLAREYKRQDKNYDPVIPEGADVLCGDQVPADISIVTDDILHKIIKCEVSGRPFRIIKQELDFYRKHNLPLPRKHPDVRHEERLRQRPPRELHLRNCDKCGIEMVSVYAKKDENLENDENVGQNNILLGNEQKVYCEKCYQQEVYG